MAKRIRKKKPLPPITMPQYLDGPSFVEFLVSEGVNLEILPESHKRRVYDWRQGARASIYGTADKILTDHCISERLIPDECWAADQRITSQRMPRRDPKEMDELREDGKMMLLNGMTTNKVARELGVSVTTAQNWRRQLEKERGAPIEPGLQGLVKKGKAYVRA